MGFSRPFPIDRKVGGRLVDQCCFVITPIDRIEIYAADASFHRTHINIVPGVRQITPRKLLIKPRPPPKWDAAYYVCSGLESKRHATRHGKLTPNNEWIQGRSMYCKA